MIRGKRVGKGVVTTVAAAMLGACASGGVTVRDRARQAEDRGDYFTAVENYQYDLEHAAAGSYESARDSRDHAAAKWIRAEIEKAMKGPSGEALGKLLQLKQAASDWALFDAGQEVQRALGKLALARLPEVAGPEQIAADPIAARDKALGLLSTIEGDDAAVAREQYEKLFAQVAAQEKQAAVDAARAGHMATALFHAVHAQAYGAVVDAGERARWAGVVDAVAWTTWTFETEGKDCRLDDRLRALRDGQQRAGRPGRLRIAIGRCETETEDEVIGRSTRSGVRYTGDSPDLLIQHQTVDDRGRVSNVTGPEGKELIKGIAQHEDTLIDVETHRRHRHRQVNGRVTAEAEGAPAVGVAIEFDAELYDTYEKASDVGTKHVDGATDEDARKQGEKEQATIASDIDNALRGAHATRARQLAAQAAAITEPEAHLEALLVAARAGRLPDDAAKELADKFHESIDDIAELFAFEDFKPAPEMAVIAGSITLPKARADADAIRGSQHINQYIDARRPGANAAIDLGIAPLQSETASGVTKYGLIIGAQLAYRMDPGPVESGAVLGGAMALRLGYSNAFDAEYASPFWLGYRTHGVALAALGELGANRYGTSGESPLWVNGAPYLGYGGMLSVMTTTAYDVSASYLATIRGTALADDEAMTLTHERRFELRASRVTPNHGDPEGFATSLALRYSSFTGSGSLPNGHVATLWLSIGIP